MIAASSKVTLLGLLSIVAIFVVLQSAALARHFVITAWGFVWLSPVCAGQLRRGPVSLPSKTTGMRKMHVDTA